jgi:ABC-type multidrug transport system ATPase subunit
MTGGAALSFRGVRKRYGKRVALDGMDVTVPRGSLCGFVGPNGAGKTTAFGIACGAIRPDAGVIDVLGGGPFDPGKHGGRLGVLPQDCAVPAHTPVRALLVYYARLGGQTRAAAERDADRVLDVVQLSDRGGARIRQLSHGMRRRVAIAQALLGEPELVLLDEPTSGLDPHLVVHVREVLARERGKRTIFVSSHVLGDLEAICDHVIFVEAGKCVKSGTIAEVTGRRERVRIVIEGDVEAAAGVLRAAMAEVSVRVEGATLIVDVAEGEDVAATNARVLPALVAAGVRVLEVHRGESLEATYMSSRGGA